MKIVTHCWDVFTITSETVMALHGFFPWKSEKMVNLNDWLSGSVAVVMTAAPAATMAPRTTPIAATITITPTTTTTTTIFVSEECAYYYYRCVTKCELYEKYNKKMSSIVWCFKPVPLTIVRLCYCRRCRLRRQRHPPHHYHHLLLHHTIYRIRSAHHTTTNTFISKRDRQFDYLSLCVVFFCTTNANATILLLLMIMMLLFLLLLLLRFILTLIPIEL